MVDSYNNPNTLQIIESSNISSVAFWNGTGPGSPYNLSGTNAFPMVISSLPANVRFGIVLSYDPNFFNSTTDPNNRLVQISLYWRDGSQNTVWKILNSMYVLNASSAGGVIHYNSYTMSDILTTPTLQVTTNNVALNDMILYKNVKYYS